MNYLSFARKYRPNTFEQLVGQEHITGVLKNAIELGKVSSAYLFAGPRGSGKTTCARILAKALNCQKAITPSPCSLCTNCKEILNGLSLDVIEIDGASNRGIDEIRQLREAVKSTPVKCRYKIYIIDEIHMLTEQAFNALLKTLEEPPKFVIFIFATTEPHKIPLTILSRCQRHYFKKISKDFIKQKLLYIIRQEKIQIDDNALELLCEVCDGSLRDAEILLEQSWAYSHESKITLETLKDIIGFCEKDRLIELFNFMNLYDTQNAISFCNSLFESGLSLELFISKLVEICRDILLFKKNLLSELEYSLEYLQKLKNLQIQEERIYTIFNELRILQDDIKRFPNESKMLWDIFLIKLSTPPKSLFFFLKNPQKLLSTIKDKIKNTSPRLFATLNQAILSLENSNKIILEIEGDLNFEYLSENREKLQEVMFEILKQEFNLEIKKKAVVFSEKINKIVQKIKEKFQGEIITDEGSGLP